MKKLIKGVVRFQRKDFESHKELFRTLGRQHNPHTLFIGCSDSRVVPTMITQSRPGELFIVRNIANIVPPYRITEEYVATTAAIEYAVQFLNVESIVVCGHSNCGGCAALHDPPERLESLPHVGKWLELAGEVRDRVNRELPDASPAEREWLTEQVNIVTQMRNLLTYPYIRQRYTRGELSILGWYYIIETGEIFNYNPLTETFEPLK